MQRSVRLNRINTVLETVEYPTTPAMAGDEFDDVIVELADGEVNLGETVQESDATRFASARELEEELLSLLPRNAVGEPYQSEGDA